MSPRSNQLLTLERIQAAPSNLTDRPVDLNSILSEVAATYSNETLKSDIAVTAHPTKAFARIFADAVMVREAITNLTDDALRHGDDAPSRVDVSLSREFGSVRGNVSDEGQGVAYEDVPIIFSRFARAKRGSGSRLGRSIAEAVADRTMGDQT